MLFIVDSKISDSAKKILSSFGELLELKTKGLVYPAISGHPDIFFCQTEDELVIAPNLPQEYFEEIKNRHGCEGESVRPHQSGPAW